MFVNFRFLFLCKKRFIFLQRSNSRYWRKSER